LHSLVEGGVSDKVVLGRVLFKQSVHEDGQRSKRHVVEDEEETVEERLKDKTYSKSQPISTVYAF